MRKLKQSFWTRIRAWRLCLPHLAPHPTASQTADITVTAEKHPEKDMEDPSKKSCHIFHCTLRIKLEAKWPKQRPLLCQLIPVLEQIAFP